MSDMPSPKWALPVWTIGAVVFGMAFVYEFVRNGFDLVRFATFVLFTAMAIDTWKKHSKS